MSSNQVASTQTVNIVPVQAVFNTAGQCLGLVGPGGAYFSPPLNTDVIKGATITGGTIDSAPIGGTTPSTVNTTGLSVGGTLVALSSTLPTIGSGFGTSPTISATNTFCFKIVVGTGGAANGSITLPSAPNGWLAFAADVTSGSSLFLQLTGSTATSVTFTSFSVTTGAASNMAAGDVILVNAMAY